MQENKVIANRFKIETMLGQGGMGTVYRGVDLQSGLPVAIKSLKPEIIEEEPSMLQRFEREGEALRLLNHPNIVKMLGTAEEDGQHYLVMEYIGGGSLLDMLKEQPQLPVQRVLEIALDLADALTRAHRMKIIHRDIKPANVMLSEDGTPKLTDFGVAQMGNHTRMTQSGMVVGTYAYLSPEVLTGEPLDARTDIWAFGIMLYEMLAGHRPFEAEQTAALLTAILNKPLPPMSDFRDDVPFDVEDLIQRMLEKDRDERINSIRLVGAQIEALMSGDTSQINQLRTPLPHIDQHLVSDRFGTPTPTAGMAEVAKQALNAPVSPSQPVPMPTTGAFAVSETPTTKPPQKTTLLLIGAGIAMLLVILIVTALLLRPDATTQTVATVAPVQAGEYMVLVAEMERIGGDERDVQRFIAEDLRQALEVNVTFSNLRVREYDGVIHSNIEALAAAEANGASVIVWGNYDDNGVTLQVQPGVTAAFQHIGFERAILERSGNVEVRISNERQESIAPLIIVEMALLHNADGNGYQIVRQLALLGAIDVPPVAIDGNNVSSRIFRAMQIYTNDRAQAVEEISAALQQDTSNPLLYSLRAIFYFQQGPDYFDETRRDIVTMERLAPASWVTPLYIEASMADVEDNLEQALTIYDEIVAGRPNEWFPLNYRGAMRYLLGDYAGAREDYEQVLTMNPDTNFPYITGTVLAMREGRINDARSYIDSIVTRFPDPSFANRIVRTYYGDNNSIFAPLFDAFGNLVLGQFEAAVTSAQAAEQLRPALADSYVVEGLAHCSLGDVEASESVYSQAIEIDPSFTLIYGLRAQVRQDLGDVVGALADFRVVNEADLGEEFAALAVQAASGEVNCLNFFDS